MKNLEVWILRVAAGVLVLAGGVRAVVVWRNGAKLNHVSGVWTALADDLRHGVFYRPMYSEDGYGGTRFFPLHFVLHASLASLGLGLIASGYLIAFASVVALLAGVYVFLRKIGLPRVLAACLAVLPLAGASTQLAAATIRGDALPAALNVWALATCVGPSIRLRHLVLASALLAGAFAAKVTTVFGLPAIFLFLAVRRRKQALAFLVMCAAGFASVLLLTQLASGGNAFRVFKTCGTGGATAVSILKAPLTFVCNMTDDGALPLVLFVLAAGSILVSPFSFHLRLSAFSFLTTTLTTLIIFASPGTAFNHLIDLDVAAILAFSDWIAPQGRTLRRFAIAAVAVGALIAAVPAVTSLRRDAAFARLNYYAEAANYAPASGGPLLAENPWVPLVVGERPYLLDPFMFRLVASRDPRTAGRLWEGLEQQRFRAVILQVDPNSEKGRQY